jgi:hypothetical protein
MTWPEIRRTHPRRWLLVEAIEARSEAGRRLVDNLAVVDAFGDSAAALREYLRLHRQSPNRELYVLHTDREDLDITERTWLGLRSA